MLFTAESDLGLLAENNTILDEEVEVEPEPEPELDKPLMHVDGIEFAGKEIVPPVGTVKPPETFMPPQNVCKAVHVFGIILNVSITYPYRLLCTVCRSFNNLLN